ncbi:MAG: hypothetical protein OEM03_06370 [Chromatiales bacterium]|nr:hypothetical protein [Chromatiales bacterium]
MLRYWSSVVLLSLFLSVPTEAAPDQVHVPDELKPWVPWVLHDLEYTSCPALGPNRVSQADFACAWPGELDLRADSDAGRFSQSWRLLAPGWVVLPGDDKTWPQLVRVNGKAVPVVSHSGHPAIYLEAGVHAVSGSFSWVRRPVSLVLPESTAMVALTVDGKPIAFPERNGEGLWLGQREDARQEEQSADLTVMRLFEDGSPMLLTTRINLRVSGKAREEVLGTALPPGFVPMSLDSVLPARIEADGRLRIQLRPGTWTLQYVARTTVDPTDMMLPPTGDNFPAEEVWTFVPNNTLRESRLLGGDPVDAERVGVPAEWRRGASFMVNAESRMTLEERSRGDSGQSGNSLRLQRTLYLDFAGHGFTALDVMLGQMRTGWRLDMQAPFELQHAATGQGDLLVTLGEDQATRGVEVRNARLELSAVSRFEGSARDMPVTGWAQPFERVTTELQLPPGYHLLAVPGAEMTQGAWVNQWTLMDFFLVLLVGVALFRLMGKGAGLLAILVLVLLHQWAPAISWAVLNLVIGIAIFGAAPEGRLRNIAKGYQMTGLAILVLLVLPFAGDLAIKALHPQLEREGLTEPVGYSRQGPAMQVDKMYESAEMVEEMAVASSREVKYAPPAAEPPGSRYAPGLLVQTGPGVPGWSWNRYQLNWSGPVNPERSFSLIIASPWVTRLWRVAGLLGMLVLTGLLARRCLPSISLPASLRGARGSAAILLVGLVALGSPDGARAEFPGPEMLQELRQRLLAPPECDPDCVDYPSARLKAAPGALEISLVVNAQAPSLLALPDAGVAWLPRQMILNGERQSFALLNQGVRYLLVPEGVSQLVLKGELAPRDLVELSFAQPPRQLALQLEGWEAVGIQDERLTAGSLQLIRKGQAGEQDKGLAAELAPEKYPPFLRVTRTVTLGLEWSVATSVTRLAPRRGAINTMIPLLPGEAVVTRDQPVKNGSAVVDMAPDQQELAWSGALSTGASLAFRASEDVPWVETWRIVVGPQWRPLVSGIPQVVSGSDEWQLDYYPRPGEVLDLSAVQPEPAPGATLAIDEASLAINPGQGASQYALSLSWRSSRGGEHRLQLSDGARLKSVVTDGVAVTVSLQDGELALPLAPGSHNTEITWDDPGSVGSSWSSPEIDLGVAASNLNVKVNMPRDRWLLASFGPRLGPAVLYWAQLLVFLVAALIVARLPHAPFPFHEWLILGLGLSMVSWGVLVWFVIWAFVVAWRGRCEDLKSLDNADMVQTGVAILTLIAIGSLVAAIPDALLGQPDMQVRGWSSYGNNLAWFQDQTSSAMPTVSVISLPLLVYKAAMLAWALWLSLALVRWLRWAWGSWTRGGLWVGKVVRAEKKDDKN